MSRRTGEDRRGRVLGRAVAVLFVVAALSQAKVQLIDRASILERAEGSHRFVVKRIDYARRGSIFSSDMRPLAQDEDTYELVVSFARTPRSRGLYMALGAACGLPASEFEQLAGSGAGSGTWRRPLSLAQKDAVDRVKSVWRADGISVKPAGRRSYGFSEAAGGLIGLFREGVAVAGLEYSLNGVLKGKDGKRSGLADRSGAFLPMRLSGKSVQVEDGAAVVLTIDSSLQVAAANAIRNAVETYKADQGVAIVMDPHTGDILAMANWPTYNPNAGLRKSKSRYSLDLNPAYQSILEPGSAFKVLTLAKALDVGKASPNQTIYCSGTMKIGRSGRVQCDLHHGSRAHGVVNAEKAIAKSCNVSAAVWAMHVGYDGMTDFIEKLGLLDTTEIGVPFEVPGLFNFKDYAKTLQIANLGFGQSISVTPLAFAAAYCMIGNHGVRPEPRLIKKVGERDTPVGPGRRVVSAQAADTALRYMESVVQHKEGTGYALRIPRFRLAGKTGTAQKIGGGNKGHVSNFVGFAPMPNPRAMILVMVDNPKGAYYGAVVAGPVFQELSRAVIRRYGIAPSDEGSSGAPRP